MKKLVVIDDEYLTIEGIRVMLKKDTLAKVLQQLITQLLRECY